MQACVASIGWGDRGPRCLFGASGSVHLALCKGRISWEEEVAQF